MFLTTVLKLQVSGCWGSALLGSQISHSPFFHGVLLTGAHHSPAMIVYTVFIFPPFPTSPHGTAGYTMNFRCLSFYNQCCHLRYFLTQYVDLHTEALTAKWSFFFWIKTVFSPVLMTWWEKSFKVPLLFKIIICCSKNVQENWKN